jgi:hypothetical protein
VTSGTRRTLVLAIGVELALLGALAIATRISPSVRPAIALQLAAAAPWVIVLREGRSLDARQAHGLAMAVGLAARAILLCGAPALSDDLYRFVWDGRVLASGVNPFRFAPEAIELAGLRDELWTRINHPEISTIYPPAAQAVFGAVALAGGGPWTIRAVVVFLDVVAVRLVSRAGADRGVPEAGLAYALCPLAVVESGLSAHFDGGCAALVLSALAWLDRSRVRAGLLVGLAIAAKALAALALPLLFLTRPRGRAVAGAVALAVALSFAVPFAGAGWRVFSGLSEFALRWSGNASAFAALERIAGAGLARIEERPGAVRSRALGRLSSALEGTPFDPRGPLRRDKKSEERDVFETGYLASLCARGAATLLVFALATGLALRGSAPRAVLGALAAALLLGPIVHPWYVLWLVPLACVERSPPWLAWSALAPLASLPLDVFRETGEWVEPWWVRPIEYLPVYALLGLDLFTAWRRRATL